MGKTIAIIGAGISGLSIAKELQKKHEIVIYEREDSVGGLIRCENIKGILFHKVGGHVFNTKNTTVAKWFWKYFNRLEDFTKADRNAKIFINNKFIGYPIENHLYELDPTLTKKIISDLLNAKNDPKIGSKDFEKFLITSFGPTLYSYYFRPYNNKIWQMPLNLIPIEWLEDKLPMPKIEEIIYENIYRKSESKMVHSSFYYPKTGGSQFIADKLSENLKIIFNENIYSISRKDKKFIVNKGREFDIIVYTGDIRLLPKILIPESNTNYDKLEQLKSNGTTTVLCEIDKLPYSWIYLPEMKFRGHRIIMTGNFSPSNNGKLRRRSCTIEFTGEISDDEIIVELQKMPFNLRIIKIHREKSSYIIHNENTSFIVSKIKKQLAKSNFYLLGRFAEWEYYNMDKAIEAALQLSKKINSFS